MIFHQLWRAHGAAQVSNLRRMSQLAYSPLTNVLKNSKSPYLLQHKDNPVAWQEFNADTIKLAQELERPIFLSSGYSACHWCHVLAHESFENEETASIMNKYFVNIKLDREERPDIDRVYMTYLQATQGGGGWPLSVFLTPKLEPFFAGTYFPPTQFRSLLARISELWEEDRERCEEMGKSVIESLSSLGGTPTSSSLSTILSQNPSKKLWSHLVRNYDPRYGGFSGSGPRATGPKFPSCKLSIDPLLRFAVYLPKEGEEDIRDQARQMAVRTLRGIWEGGIHDWAGKGIARYSVDEKWLVPHFEKMLYDQAQVAAAAIDFSKISSTISSPSAESDVKLCQDLAADIIEYTIRDLLSPEGGFYGAEDADSAPSPGVKKSEGAFYLWTKEEFDEVVGADAELVGYHLGIKDGGNVPDKHDAHGEMTGKNILHQARSIEETVRKYEPGENGEVILADKVRSALEKLKRRRDETRERPGLDDKILTSWNGLMLTALAKAGTNLPFDKYPIAEQCLPAAARVVEYIKENVWDAETRTLTRSWREGKGPIGQTDDYAFLIQGLLELYDATGNEEHVLFARELQERQDELFWDDEKGGYFASAPDEHVLVRMKDAQDAAEPSATSVSVHNLMKLSLIFADEYEKWEKRATDTFLSVSAELGQYPQAVSYTTAALMDLDRGHRTYYLTGKGEDPTTSAMLRLLHASPLSNKVIIHLAPEHPSINLGERNVTVREIEAAGSATPSLRVCEGRVCGLPMKTVDEVKEHLLHR